jgi:hypothetical protein
MSVSAASDRFQSSVGDGTITQCQCFRGDIEKVSSAKIMSLSGHDRILILGC